MTAIDLSDADEFDRLQREPLNVEINAAVERAVAATARLSRLYLGASIVGHECPRQIQYDWMCTPELSARVRLIFDRGHAFEALVRAQLVLAGFQFAPKEALEFVALDGFLQGHADGIVTSGPDCRSFHLSRDLGMQSPQRQKFSRRHPQRIHRRRFRAMRRRSPSISTSSRSPIPALVSCVNADTCETLHLALPFDATRAKEAIACAQAIIDATRAGDLLPRFTGDPENFQCRICQHRRRCWGKP